MKQTNAPIGIATNPLSNTLPEVMKAMLPEPEEIAKGYESLTVNKVAEYALNDGNKSMGISD